MSLVGAGVLTAGFFAAQLYAQAPIAADCIAFHDTRDIPAGFGSPVNVFSSERALLLRASCEHDELRLYAGNIEEPAIDTAIWQKGFVWEDGWQPFTFEADRTYNGWIFGATQHVRESSNAEMLAGKYFVAYVCTKQEAGWRCGCRDQACASPNWMVQKVALTLAPSDTATPAQGASRADDLKARVFALTNTRRDERDLGELLWDAALAEIARAHSEDMARRTFFEHENPDGCNSRCRVEAASYAYQTVAENLYFELDSAGIESAVVADNTIESWLASASHRRNLLAPDITHSGVGVVLAGNTAYITALYSVPGGE